MNDRVVNALPSTGTTVSNLSTATGIFAQGNPTGTQVTGNTISGNTLGQVNVRRARGLQVSG